MADIYSVTKSGKVSSTTPGTAVRFSAQSQPVAKVIVTANQDNNETVVVGDSAVVAATGTRQGVPLVQGQSQTFNVSDLNQLYLDVVTSGDKIAYQYFL